MLLESSYKENKQIFAIKGFSSKNHSDRQTNGKHLLYIRIVYEVVYNLHIHSYGFLTPCP